MSPKNTKNHRILSNFTKQSPSTAHRSDALYQLRIGGSYLQNHQKHRILSNFTKQSLRRLTTLMLCISYALAFFISPKSSKASNFIEFYKSRVFDDSPL